MSINNKDNESEILGGIMKYDSNVARYYTYIQQLNHDEEMKFRSLVQRLDYLMEQEKNILTDNIRRNKLAILWYNLRSFLLNLLLGFIMGSSLVVIYFGIFGGR